LLNVENINTENMPIFFVFLLKVNIALIIFCIGYYLVLKRLTFYTLNRLYLNIAIIFSSVYPGINIAGFLQRHQQFASPVQTAIVSLKMPAENLVKPIILQPDYWTWAQIIFWSGVLLFAMRLFMQMLSLYKLYKSSEPGKIHEYKVRLLNANVSPFSFWQNIFINPKNLSPHDLYSILQHEQVHIKEWHTLDILLTEISVIFYWFNPGVWLIKKAVRDNIEFITDRKILQKGVDSKAYQYSLLNVSFINTNSAGIINNFNFSNIKKRIEMMNAKRSPFINITRYVVLVPAILICLFAFALSKARLVKTGPAIYKAIEAHAVNPTIPANQVRLVKMETGYFRTLATPVNNPIGASNVTNDIITTSNKIADTTKKPRHDIMTMTSVSIINGDTVKKASLILTNETNDSVNYFINGKQVTKIQFSEMSPEDVLTVSMGGNMGTTRSVNVITKINHN
jgi:bla regulator protein BlaR1